MKAVGRAAATAVLAGLLGAACIALFYAWHAAIAIDFDRDLPKTISGIYSPERDPSGLSFAWTSGEAALTFPGLDRRAVWILDLRVRGGRPMSAENPDITILADGVAIQTMRSTPDFTDLRASIPAFPSRRGLVVGIVCSKTFVPGPGDPRPLGVMLDRLVLAPEGVVLVPRPALSAASLSAAAMGAAIALLGVTAGSAIGGGVLLSAATAAVLARGFGPFSGYPADVTRLALWIALALAGLPFVVQRLRRQPFRNTARFAIAFSAAALFLKLLVLLHPNMPIGDAMFHAHRFEGVLGGRLYFTSIAPGGYAFPYPPGLYVFASLFSGLVHRGPGDVVLLRCVTCAVDAAAGLLLYWSVGRVWNNRLAGATAVAIYHLMPLNFGVLTTGNLTNAFAQSVAIGAFAMMSAPSLTPRRWTRLFGLTAVLAIAFMSHTSTMAILFVAAIATSILFLVRGEQQLRSPAAGIAIATAVAAAISGVVYYSHFMDTYRAEFARIGHETIAVVPAVGGRTIDDRLRGVPYFLGINIGGPALLLAFVGVAALVHRRPADPLTLTLGAWIGSCAAFLALGVLTPIDMRYYLAVLPAVAIAAGYGTAWAWNDASTRQRGAYRLAAAVCLAAAISTGFQHWWSTLG